MGGFIPNIGYIALSDIEDIMSQEDFDPRWMGCEINYLLSTQGFKVTRRCLELQGTVVSKRDENGWVYVQHLEER